jgi:amino acid transporter/nucleotide-binding universal stress UspA family protein
VACSLYAIGFGAYFSQALPLLGIPHLDLPLLPVDKWLAVAVVVVFAYINYRGAAETGGAGNFVTLAKILVLAVFIAFGVWITLHRPDWQLTFSGDFMPNGMGKVFMAMGLTFIAFEGYEIIAQCSEEVRAPERNVPRAVFLSLLIVVPIYLLVAFAALGAAPETGVPAWQFLGLKKETALVEVAGQFFRGGGILILLGGLLSTMSALNATIYSSSRVSFAMGRDRNLPSWFGKVHPVRKTPHWAILASAVLIAFMAAALPIEAVASASDIMFLLLFVQVLMVLIALRKKRPDLRRGFRVPLVPLVPVIGIMLQLTLAVFLCFYSPMALLSTGAWICLGLVVFYAYARRRDRSYEQMVAVREAAAHREYRILACIGDPRRAKIILHAAAAVARRYDGELIALSVVEVPERELLAQGLERAFNAREMLTHAVDGLQNDGIPAQAVVKISHRISYGITETALEERCNMVVMGRGRRAGLLERFAATIVDRVVRTAPAQVMVISAERWPEKPRAILFAYERGPHAAVTADVAGALSKTGQGLVRAVHVLPRSATPAQDQAAKADLNQVLGSRYDKRELKVVHSGDIVTGLLRESKDTDIIVIGGTEAGVMEQLLGYALPLELAERTAKAVVTVYEMPAEPKRWLV